MRTFLYNVSILIFRVLLPFAAKFSHKLKLFYNGRKNLLKNIKSSLDGNSSPLFWVHCSSVGEFEQGLPVIELLKKENPTWNVVVTFFSSSGYQAVNHRSIDFKFYLPIDTAPNAKQFLDLIEPQLVIFIKYEFWYHYLSQLNRRSIPTFSVSSIFRPSQAFFKWYGSWNRKMLRQFTYFMVQDEDSLELLKSIGLTNACITGDTRFDRVLEIKNNRLQFPEIEKFIDGSNVFIVGSLRPEDNDTIFEFIHSNQNFKYIIAPHEITETHILNIENAIGLTVRHSQLTLNSMANILIIDSIGKLSALYSLANFAYVGGGFSDGIHNILEPAIYNIPVFFGNKYYKKYKEATDLVKLNAAFPVSGTADLIAKINKLNDQNLLLLVRNQLKEYVNSNTGAAQKVVSSINQLALK